MAEKNNDYIVAFSDFVEESFKNKNVLNLCGEQNKAAASVMIKAYGAKAKRDMSDKIDFILTDARAIIPHNKTKAAVLDFVESEDNKDKIPPFIDFYNLRNKTVFNFSKKIENETLEEKLERAKRIFDFAVREIGFEMRANGEYGLPGAGEDAYISTSVRGKTDIDMEGVNEFFDYVAKNYDTMSYFPEWVHYNGSWELRKDLDSCFNSMKTEYCGIGGCVGLRLPLALSIAVFVFADPNADVNLNYTRDKWERRGDYNANKRITFRLSPVFADGYVYWQKYRAYEM